MTSFSHGLNRAGAQENQANAAAAAEEADVKFDDNTGVNPHFLADAVYEAIARDTDERITSKGQQNFRDKIFENCTPKQIVIQGERMGSHSCMTLMKLIKKSSIQRLDLGNNKLKDYGVVAVLKAIESMPSLKHGTMCFELENRAFAPAVLFFVVMS